MLQRSMHHIMELMGWLYIAKTLLSSPIKLRVRWKWSSALCMTVQWFKKFLYAIWVFDTSLGYTNINSAGIKLLWIDSPNSFSQRKLPVFCCICFVLKGASFFLHWPPALHCYREVQCLSALGSTDRQRCIAYPKTNMQSGLSGCIWLEARANKLWILLERRVKGGCVFAFFGVFTHIVQCAFLGLIDEGMSRHDTEFWW